MEYNLMAVLLVPVWTTVAVACGLAARLLSPRAGSDGTRALIVCLVLFAGLAVEAAVLFATWGPEWWTFTVPEPAGVLLMGVLPLIATGSAVWRRPNASIIRTLLTSAANVAIGVVVFVGLGLLLGMPTD